MASDATAYVIETLKAADSVTDLIMGAEDGIFESGDLDMSYVAQAEDSRRIVETPTKILAVVVQDGGETATTETRHNQTVNVWLYDRQRGYANIRAVRNAIYLVLDGRTSALEDPAGIRTGILDLHFQDRSGHLHALKLALDYELLTYEATVHLDLS